MFPNSSILRPTSLTIRVWHPRGPDKTECWAWVFVDKAAPPEVKKALRLAGARVFGPAGTFEQDDQDNWQGCTQTGRQGAPQRRAGREGERPVPPDAHHRYGVHALLATDHGSGDADLLLDRSGQWRRGR